MTGYESCVIGVDGTCTRWSHDHDPDQLSIDDALADVIPSRTTDPETSHAAAREIRVKAGTQRAPGSPPRAERGSSRTNDSA